MKEEEMGEACRAQGREEKYVRSFWLENLKEGHHLEELDVDITANLRGFEFWFSWLRTRTNGRLL
jgi:hypothetical protein